MRENITQVTLRFSTKQPTTLQQPNLHRCVFTRKYNFTTTNFVFSQRFRNLIAMKQFLLYSILFGLLMGCGSNKQFTEQDNQDYQSLQDMVALKSFEIVSNSAMPIASASYNRVATSRILGPGNNAGNIDISSNGNKVTVKGDSIQGYLPFFGDQHFGGGYGGTNGGIEFNDIPENYKVVNNDKKHAVEVSFKIKDSKRPNEQYNMTITLYPNNRTYMRVQSSNRSSIDYSGRVSKLDGDK